MRIARPEKEVVAIGQEVRPTVAVLAATYIQLRSWLWYTSVGRDTQQRLLRSRRKDDHTILAPSTTPPDGGVAQSLWWPAVGIDLFQLAVGEESDLAAVRRPEGVTGGIEIAATEFVPATAEPL
jgi:hypothetical protein